MGQRSQRWAGIIGSSLIPWYEPDAVFAWSPVSDQDATQVDPSIGSPLLKVSAGAATVSSNLWDMTAAVYNNISGARTTIDTSKPFMMAMAVDKNNQASTFSTCFNMGFSTDTIGFGFSSNAAQPVARISWNTGAFVQQAIMATTITKGTIQILWYYVNASDPTFQIVAGTNQTTVTQVGSLTVPTRTIAVPVSVGALYNGTTGVSQLKQGLIQIVGNRSGASALTLSQCLAIVQKMQNVYGI